MLHNSLIFIISMISFIKWVVLIVTIVVGSNKGRRYTKVERRSRFISSSLSPIWLLRSSGLQGKVGLYSASKRCRRNGNIVTLIISNR